MKAHACLSCGNLDLSSANILDPTTSELPHLSAQCIDCPFKDAYGFPTHEGSHHGLQPIWVNLETMEAWVDGGNSIPHEGCEHYHMAAHIKKPEKS